MEITAKKAVLGLFVWITVLAGGCNEKTTTPVYACEGILYDKPLDNIRACIVGNWQLHYSYGGLTGNWRNNFKNKYWIIESNDSIYYVDSVTVVIRSKINWVKATIRGGNQETYLMTFEESNGFPFVWYVEQIRQDTLVLVENAFDGYGYYLTKK